MTSLAPRLGGIRFGGDYNPEQWPPATWPRRRRADAAGGRRPGLGGDLLLGPAGARAGPVHVRLAGRGAWTCSPAAASWSTSPPPRPRRRRGWHSDTPRPVRSRPTARSCGRAAGRRTARARRCSVSGQPPWSSGSPPTTATTRRLPCGTWATSTPATSPAAGATPAPRRSAPGCGRRYGDLDTLNEAWGTAFWSQRYTDWEQVQPPRATPTFANPGQRLDFRRFSSDEHLACFVAERDLLHRITPGRTGHDELHGAQGRPRLLGLGRRGRRRQQRPLPDRHRPGPTRRPGLRGRHHPRARPRAPVVADGALHQRRQLAAAQRAQAPGRDDPQQPAARGQRCRRRAVLPVAAVEGRRGEVPLGAGAARRSRLAAVPRGGRARRDPRPARAGGRLHRAFRRGAGLQLGVVVGRRGRRAPERRRALPRGRARPARRALRAGDHRRRGAARRRSRRLPAGAGSDPAPGQRCRRGGAGGVRPRRRPPAGHVLLGHRRRARPRPARRLPRRVPRPARRAGRGVPPAAGRGAGAAVGTPRHRRQRRRLDRGPARRRTRHRGGAALRRRRAREACRR